MGEGYKLEQQHGKSRVRVCRVWRRPQSAGGDVMVEWNVAISLLSDCLPAYFSADNSSIVATDTMKNTVYAKAKECSEVVSMESFAIFLARHFTTSYPQVTTAIVRIVQKPWERVTVDGQPHIHGFKLGSEKHTTEVTLKKCGALNVTSGVEGLALLKTTQSGFEGFVRDHYTVLPETRERMLATEVTASWRYDFEHVSNVPVKPFCFSQRFQDVKKVLVDTFFGPPNVGVYSPSVQNTLYLMAKAVLDRFQDIAFVQLKMPNIHFLPVNLSSKDNASIVKQDRMGGHFCQINHLPIPTRVPHRSSSTSPRCKTMVTLCRPVLLHTPSLHKNSRLCPPFSSRFTDLPLRAKASSKVFKFSSMEAPPPGYRKNVGICLMNSSNKIFSASRLDIPGAWQMPQGGVDEGEDPRVAAIRELREETGVTSAEILAEAPHWLTYDFPPEVKEKLNKRWGTNWKGQAQKWFLLKFTGKDEEINLAGDGSEKPEFAEWAWMTPKQVIERAVEFKKPVYEEVLKVFAPHFPSDPAAAL